MRAGVDAASCSDASSGADSVNKRIRTSQVSGTCRTRENSEGAFSRLTLHGEAP